MKEKLIQKAKEAMMQAYAPYSGYFVGAAVQTADGSIYTGCNVENASYSATNCAERTAIFKAVSEGHRQIVAVAVCGGKAGERIGFFPPCGVCRQVMAEFCQPDTPIHLIGKGEECKTVALKDLLPHSFDSSSMEI